MRRGFFWMPLLVLFVLGVVLSVRPARPAPPPEVSAYGASLVELLPDSTLVAVDLAGLGQRWHEIEERPALKGFVERVSEGLGVPVRDLLRLAGDRVVVGIFSAAGERSWTPIAVVRPPTVADALALRALLGASRSSLVVRRGRGVLWLGPASHSQLVTDVAEGDGTSVVDHLAIDAVAHWLPAGGLVRGWIHVDALRDALRSHSAHVPPGWVELLWAGAIAELEAVRFAGFRRDLTDEGVVTDFAAGYDLASLPPELSAAFAAPPTAPALAAAPPPGTVAACSFRPEAGMWLPWMRFVAANDRQGPFRNIDFWMREFEERSGARLQDDLFALLGERAWLFITRAAPGEELQVAVIVDTSDAARVERTLLLLRAWYAELTLGCSLGFVIPLADDSPGQGAVIHELQWWTPLGRLPGPAFAVAPGYLVVGSGKEAVARGLETIAKPGFAPLDRASGQASRAHVAFTGRGEMLASLVGLLEAGHFLPGDHPVAEALRGLGAEIDGITGRVWYEENVVRLQATVGCAKLAH
ncbi:MAG: hypothetical protein AB1486_15705 [Planctomycetota bacterium]